MQKIYKIYKNQPKFNQGGGIMALKRINNRHKRAMLLHCQGMNYEQIAEQVGVAPSTVENWFYRDTTFRAEYEKFKQEYIEDITKTAKERMQKAADEAMQTLLILMANSESDRIRQCCQRYFRQNRLHEDILNIKGNQELEINITLTGDEDED